MANKIKISKKIQNNVYPTLTIFSVNQSDEEFESYLSRFDLSIVGEPELLFDSLSEKVGRGVKFADGWSTAIRLNFYPEINRDYALLQHEIFHVTNYIMEQIGMVYSDDSAEAYCYMNQFLTNEIYNIIDKAKKSHLKTKKNK